MLLIPDPMGATGSTISKVIEQYGAEIYGRPLQDHRGAPHHHARVSAARDARSIPRCIVYALRLDRGLSPADVLQTMPGERWDEERGLTDHHYIVPGGGGLGEVMNNSFV